MTSSVRQRLAYATVIVLAIIIWMAVIGVTVPEAQSVFPQPNGDYGFFTAVAERLASGDRLYIDIWDNKDPFVFYAIAVAKGFAGVWGTWALELMWIVALSIVTWTLATWAHVVGPLRLFAALAAAPFLVIGLPYFMGSTHVPGIVLALASLAAWLRGRPLFAGVFLAALAFFKLIMLPLAVVMIVVALVVAYRAKSQPSPWRRVGRMLLAFVAGVTAVFLLLGLRGELVPYLRAMLDNVFYSQAPLVPQTDPSLVRWIIQHIVILVNPHVFAILIASIAILTLFAIQVLHGHRGHTAVTDRILWWVALSAFVIEVVTIAAVGKWLHHALILVVSSILIMLLTARMFKRVNRDQHPTTILALAVLTFVLAGLPNPSMYAQAVTDLPANMRAAQEIDRFTNALRETPPGSLAIISQGNLAPRSFSFSGWSLACRHIAQRHFDPVRNFDETIACLPSADVVVIAPDVEPRDGFDRFNAFLDQARVLSEEDRECTDVDGFRICRKR